MGDTEVSPFAFFSAERGIYCVLTIKWVQDSGGVLSGNYPSAEL